MTQQKYWVKGEFVTSTKLVTWVGFPLVICGSTGWISVNVTQGVTGSVNARIIHNIATVLLKYSENLAFYFLELLSLPSVLKSLSVFQESTWYI